jgi:hypothetical protein
MAINGILILSAALALSGCAAGTFTTRGACTIAGDKVILVSQWGVLPGISTELDQRDAAPILKECKK